MPVLRPLVSVIVRTKDRPETLRVCLESIILQDYRPVHVVIVNDGGVDVSDVVSSLDDSKNSAEVKDNLVLELLQLETNVGRTAAANQGLEGAKGDYICFLDDDDYWLPTHLSSLVSHLCASDLERVDTGYPECAVYSATKAVLVGVGENSEGAEIEQEIKVYNTAFDRNHLFYSNYLPIMSVLFSRAVVDAGVRFDTALDLFEDWDFWLQVSEKIPFIATSDVTSVYRLHDNASGVHDAVQVEGAYLAIYNKWLSHYSSVDFYELLRKTHQWRDQTTDELQRVNQEKLNVIGEQHTHAVETIKAKDANIMALEEAHSYALSVVTEKEEDVKRVSKEYEHAVSVIQEKDQASEGLVREYEHAIEVIKEKDLVIKQLALDLQKKSETITFLEQENAALADRISVLERLRNTSLVGRVKRVLGR
ncbi:glycosyltransferase [Alkalimarinus alittae]|uniref:Glycosyltransferase n=1 Tax=Alkalimarinus alittae TaxID=2961619 RepID=A0ABY6MZ77_9ALTE|nr:glycosyltransferase [Alkalimarinus alittae]UZE95128.1 glycosyltransferase [Alkalimarinus alittae]